MPSSVKLGVRPMSDFRRVYSSGLRPWAATSAGVILGAPATPDDVFDLFTIGQKCHCRARPGNGCDGKSTGALRVAWGQALRVHHLGKRAVLQNKANPRRYKTRP